jgi:protein tyrosine/serine phosphatase
MMNWKNWLTPVVFFGLVSWAGAQTPEANWASSVTAAPLKFTATATKRPAPAPNPGAGSGQGLPNFAKVTGILYRSGQPTQQGVSQLAAKGVKTILKLNADDPAEPDWAAADGITLIPQLMDNHSSPSYAQVDAALAIIMDSTKQPVLVHCHLGHDRTGAVVAAYQVLYNGKSVADAAAEAKSFGYGAPGFSDITTWLTGYVAHHAGN